MIYMKFTILVHPSFVIITIYIVWLINTWDSREKELKRNNAFFYMTDMAAP